MSPVVLSGDVFLVWWHHEGPAASDSNGPYDRQVMPLECNLSPRIYLNSPHSRPPTNCYGKPLPANLADHSICWGGAGQVQAPVRTVLAGWLRLPSVLAGTVQVAELAYTSLSLSLSLLVYIWPNWTWPWPRLQRVLIISYSLLEHDHLVARLVIYLFT